LKCEVEFVGFERMLSINDINFFVVGFVFTGLIL